MATRINAGLLLSCLAMLGVLTPVSFALSRERSRRSDDTTLQELQVTVSGMTQQLLQLQARIQAQESDMQAQKALTESHSTEIQHLKAQLAADEQAVAFLASFGHWDIHGLGQGQTLKFNNVLYNVGSGFDSATGYFTAPSSGTYFISVEVMRHHNDTAVGLYKRTTLLTRAEACCVVFNTATASYILHLDAGEAVHVQMYQGSEVYGLYTKFMGIKVSSN